MYFIKWECFFIEYIDQLYFLNKRYILDYLIENINSIKVIN